LIGSGAAVVVLVRLSPLIVIMVPGEKVLLEVNEAALTTLVMPANAEGASRVRITTLLDKALGTFFI